MLLTILINLISVFIFLYILWNKLKDDYSASMIFSAGFSVAISVVIANLVALWYLPEYWFWFSIIGVIVGMVYAIHKLKLSFYEFADSLVISLHPWLGLIFLDKFASSLNYISLLLVLQIVITGILYIIFDKSYKSFSWYRSGRIGFSGFAVLGIYFLIRTVIALTFSDMISFVGIKDAIISSSISFFMFLILFNLSRSKT
ncbi:hypothetical protein JXA63_02995 [Candidatus Woesebacteria bacterium]|nr:hypothetical protein [Candidatus Woesebacteria bacterium]